MGHGATMAGFCQILTGLNGRYDFKINFEPESSGEGFHPIGAGIFTPIQHLGLRLEPQKDQRSKCSSSIQSIVPQTIDYSGDSHFLHSNS